MKLEVAPDKGWAWVVAFASCFIHMFTSGLNKTMAMLYVEIINTYGISRQSATIPFSVRNSMRCIAGPLAGIAGQYFQVRSVTFWGGVLCFVGIALCSFTSNIFWLTIFWGIINGLGFALSNSLFLVVVNQYFKRHRTTACGISLSGSGLGTLLFPFMLEFIINNYDISGIFLLLAGVTMQVLPLSLLLRSPPWTSVKEGNKSQAFKNGSSKSLYTKSNHDSVKEILSKETNLDCKSFRATYTATCTDVSEVIEPKNYSTSCNNTQNSTTFDVRKDLKKEKDIDRCKDEYLQKPEKTILQSSTFLRSCMSILELFLNPMYFLLSVCCASIGIELIIISTVIVDYGKDKGLSESEGKYLIICTAVGDLFGRLCFGWITDKKFLTAQKFTLLTLIFQGIVTALFPLVYNFITFAVLLTSFGMISSSTLVLLPGLITEYVSIEKLPLAMSCLNLLAGLASFAIPSCIGYFRDNIGSYDGLFYISGGLSALCGSLWVFESSLVKFLPSKNESS